MPTIVALDTATAEISVAVLWPGGVLGRRMSAGRGTGALLAPMVRDLVTEAGLAPRHLDAVAVGLGPGPYTSLRAGIMFARATGFALGIPVLGACTLDVMARGLHAGGVRHDAHRGVGPDRVIAIDARRREVYWARYDATGTRVAGPLVGPPSQVRAATSDALWFGPADGRSAEAADAASDGLGPDAAVLAEWVAADGPHARLAAVTGVWDGAREDGGAAGRIPQALLRPDPLYLRRPDAAEPTVAFGVRP